MMHSSEREDRGGEGRGLPRGWGWAPCGDRKTRLYAPGKYGIDYSAEANIVGAWGAWSAPGDGTCIATDVAIPGPGEEAWDAAQAAAEAALWRAGGFGPRVCAFCGKPAACFGSYEGRPTAYACDACCGHGCEDGHCEPVEVAAQGEPAPREPSAPTDDGAAFSDGASLQNLSAASIAQIHDMIEHPPAPTPALRALFASAPERDVSLKSETEELERLPALLDGPDGLLAWADRQAGAGKATQGLHLLARTVVLLRGRVDSLTAPAMADGEALGRDLFLSVHGPWMGHRWDELHDPAKLTWMRAALALHAIGYAAGRSEGEAERARLRGDLTQARAQVKNEVRKGMEAEAEVERQRGEITRLTAELAEARAAVESFQRNSGCLDGYTIGDALAKISASLDKTPTEGIPDAIARLKREKERARHDGAREEREAILLHLADVRETWTKMGEGDALFTLKQITNAIRARGEGQGS